MLDELALARMDLAAEHMAMRPPLSNPSPLALPASAPGNQLLPDGVVVVGPIVSWHPADVLVRPSRRRQAYSAQVPRGDAEAVSSP